MKPNLLYTSLNVTALAVALLSLCGTASVFVMSFLIMALVALVYVPDSFIMAIGAASFCVLLAAGVLLARKCGRGKLVCETEKSRGQSFLLWETPAFLLLSLLFFLSWRTDLDWPLVAGLCLPVAALALALAFPFPRCRNGFWTAVRIFGFIGALGAFLLVGLILGRAGKEVSYFGNDPTAFPPAVRWIGKTYVPAGASEIRLEGRSTACRWSCRVPEKDFQKFRAKSAFEFTLVEKPRDAYDKGPFPYWFYENRHGDGGGVTLRYEVGSQTLTGWYAHH